MNSFMECGRGHLFQKGTDMIYDCIETFMDVENLKYNKDGSVTEYLVNYDELESGKRYLEIPEGIIEICQGTFSEYNSNNVVQGLTKNLVLPEYSINEWMKRLSRRQLVKIKFPPEVGVTLREKAMYMVEKEFRIRFLKLFLPKTIKKLHKDSYPVLLDEINVDIQNPYFTSLDGVLFSKDMKTLIRFPGYKTGNCYTVPEGVEKIKEGAFDNSFIRNLILPHSLIEIESRSFVNVVIEEIKFSEGITEISKEAFVNCDIKRIIFPSSLVKIGDYAFKGTSGIQELICNSETVSLGVGLFKEGIYKDVKWWPWEVIPKGTFLNSNIKSIIIPEGVASIEMYAFAGCYQAKEIIIANSVKYIGLHSFDEGYSYSDDISLPKHLSHFAFRFPTLSRINSKEKSAIWKEREITDFQEEPDILQEHLDHIDKYLKTLNVFQSAKKNSFQRERDFILKIMNGEN